MRLFIGITVPEELRERLQDAWSKIKEAPGEVRYIAPENWHFTLAFLGQVEEENKTALIHLIEKAVERPPKGAFSFTDFRTFPNKHPSYLIASATAHPEKDWTAFIQRLRDMVSVVAPDIDRKPWVPHVTLARSRRNKLLPRWSHPFEPFEWQPKSLILVKSTPTQNGSRYTDLHVFTLNI